MIMDWRQRVTRFFLWVSVLMWGPLLGAKVFDLVVLAGAWSGSPPDSLRLLPYGSDYPVDTGEFFIPSSALLLFATFGALVSGWRTPLSFRALLAVSAIAIFATLVLTVVIFWPLNFELWNYATGSSKANESVAEIVGKARFWITMDWFRVAAAAIGFIASIRAISLPYPKDLAPKDPVPVVVLLVLALLAVAAFLVYFVMNL